MNPESCLFNYGVHRVSKTTVLQLAISSTFINQFWHLCCRR